MTNMIQTLLTALDLRRDPPGADGHAVILRSRDGGERLEDIERYQPAPRRLNRRVVHYDFSSFLFYLDERKEEDTRVYIGPQTIVAYIDHPNTRNEPTWCVHQSGFSMRYTTAFQMWREQVGERGKANSQEEFALLLERRAADVLQPDAATMQEIALTLEAKPKVAWKSAVNLNNGARQFFYEEDAQAKAGAKGEIVIPSRFQIGVALYDGAPPVNLDIRMRYRLNQGQIRFVLEWVDLDQAEKDTRDKMKDIIETKHGVPCYIGQVDPPPLQPVTHT